MSPGLIGKGSREALSDSRSTSPSKRQPWMPPPAAAAPYEIEEGCQYLYGTAGFRMSAALMAPVAYRVGLLAAALSSHHGGQTIGIMLTASHNPLPDNGVKIVAPDGGMLPSVWESVAEEIVRTPLAHLPALMRQRFPTAEGGDAASPSSLVVGRDTRPSGPVLVAAVQQGAQCWAETAQVPVRILDVGQVTTPELHVATARLNREAAADPANSPAEHERRYLQHIADAFASLVGLGTRDHPLPPREEHAVIVDCANGVGAGKIKQLSSLLADRQRTGLGLNLNLVPINDGSGEDDILNEGCGADHIKTTRGPPRLSGSLRRPAAHYAALDGDADRLVYFTFVPHDGPGGGRGEGGEGGLCFRLIDGDHIAALAALTATSLLRDCQRDVDDGETFTVGVVQTAYANGAASDYIQRLGVHLVWASTGVKFLHEAAHRFDVGIYFEANGHGTILFSDRLRRHLAQLPHVPAAQRLAGLARLANELVGDGIADLLLVEAMLWIMGMGILDWCGLYGERPSCLLKVAVRDRTLLQTEDADRRIVRPAALQEAIDKLVGAVGEGGRAFARPSGTEDVVRIYAEAPRLADAEQLALRIASIIPDYL